MPIGSETVGKLGDLAITGASVLAPALGVPSAFVDLVAKGGSLALAIRGHQQDKWTTYLVRIRRAIERDYIKWLKRECGDDWEKHADIEAVFLELDDLLPRMRFDSKTVVDAGHNAQAIAAKLRESLPSESLIRKNETAGRVFSTLVAASLELVQADDDLSAELTSLSFERVFTELERAEDAAERRHREVEESNKRRHNELTNSFTDIEFWRTRYLQEKEAHDQTKKQIYTYEAIFSGIGKLLPSGGGGQ